MIFQINQTEIGALRADFRRFVNGQPLYAHHSVNRGDTIEFVLNVPRRLASSKVEIVFFAEDGCEKLHLPMLWHGFDLAEDEYRASLTVENDLLGLYFYSFTVESAYGTLFGGRAKQGGDISFHTGSSEHFVRFQLTVTDFDDPAPSWIYGSVIYHVFVDRFRRCGDTPVRENAILNNDWENGIPQYPEYPGGPLENNMFFGGNLAGIEEKLDYFASLGVKCLYLSPIFEAYSNHKYDTGDYMKIDAMFGGEEAFLSLLKEADKKGIRIVLDGVFNHTGDDSVYFNRYGRYSSLGAYQSKKSPYYSWYRFQDFPEKYTSWWNIPILPRIHPEEPSCNKYFVGKKGVIAHYAKLGIGGFRLDVADELSDSFIADIRKSLRANANAPILYGEVWEDASNKIAYGQRKRYYSGHELDGVMNYPLRTGLIEFLRYKHPEPLRYALTEVLPNAPKRIADAQMNLLGTHDTERILTALAARLRGNRTNDEIAIAKMTDEEYSHGVTLLKMAYTALATLPGIPTIFYGDEVGMQGYGDPFNRLPFPWHNIDNDLLAHYQTIGRLRQENTLYREGNFALLRLDEEVLVFLRFDFSCCLLTCLNLGEEKFLLPVTQKATLLFSQNAVQKENGVYVPACESIVLSLPHQEVKVLHEKNGISLPSFLKRDPLFQ